MTSREKRTEVLGPSVVSYVAGVVFIAIMTGVLCVLGGPKADPLVILFWTVAFLIGEAMSFKTPTGRGNVSMAATIHLAAIPILGFAAIIPAVWGSRLAANLIVQRQAWYKALFNAAQVSLALILAAMVYKVLGGPYPVTLDRGSLFQVIPALMGASAAYYFLNTGFVVGVLALSTSTPYRKTWRENFGYRVEIASSIALFLLAPVAIISYQAVGEFGIVVFFLPMLFIRDACYRYIALEQTQRALIGSERLAAKGEMAASVGHELNNYLSVLSGNLQLMQFLGGENASEKDKERMKKIFEQVSHMATLSKGLMDFSKIDSRVMPTNASNLVRQTVEFLRPQNRLDGIAISLELDERVGTVMIDPAQFQQMLMNLINNAADAMKEAKTERPRLMLWLRWHSSSDELELGVQDNGPGVPSDLKRRIFEPNFTTKETGHGFGLSTVYRIVSNHGGTIGVEDAADGGAVFRLQIPAQPAARRSLAA